MRSGMLKNFTISHSEIAKIFIFILAITLLSKANGQSPVFRNYTTVQGLPSSESYCSLQDSKGYLWFSTDRGIAKYDGYSFQVFTTSEGLPDNTIFRLFEDKQSRIWFVGYSSKTGYIENNKVHLYKYNAFLHSLFPDQIITNLFVDKQNGLWINYNLGITLKILHITSDGIVDSSFINAAGIRTVYVSESGECMVSGARSAAYVQFISIESGKKLLSLHSKNNSVHETNWIRRKRGETLIYLDNNVFLLRNGACTKVIEPNFDGLYCLVDSFDNVWITYRDHGVEVYSPKDNYKTGKEFLKNYSINSITQDAEGGMWFTSLEKGIFYFSPSKPYAYMEEDGVPRKKINRIEFVDSNAILILASQDVLIKRYKHKKFELSKKGRDRKLIDIQYKPPDKIYYTGPMKNLVPLTDEALFL